MEETLKERLKQTEPFAGPDQEAMLSLLVASAAVQNRIDDVCQSHDLLASQYNVLRILAGGPPEGYPRCDIIERMIDRSPDVTRLVDDLEEKGLVERSRSQEDRRKMMHRITDAGRRRLDAVTEDLHDVREPFRDEFSDDELRQFTRLCAGIYQQFEA